MAVDTKRAQGVFFVAVEATDARERASILDRECGADPELRQRVEALLQAHHSPDSILDAPLPFSVNPLPSEATVAQESSTDPGGPGVVPHAGGTHADDAALGLEFLQPSRKVGSVGRLSHYEILEIVGTGGFGTVLKAFDEKLHRVVAIKVLTRIRVERLCAQTLYSRSADCRCGQERACGWDLQCPR